MKHMFTYILSAVLLMGYSSCNDDDQTFDYVAIPKTEVGKKLVEHTNLIASISQDTTYTVAAGAQATEIKYLSQKGLAMKAFIFEIDLNNPNVSIEATTPNDGPQFAMQKMTEQAKVKDSATRLIWGGVNADFFNVNTGVPQGIVYKNGLAIKKTFQDATCTFFAITKDRLAVIGDETDYKEIESNIAEAVGGRVTLVKDGTLPMQTSDVVEPRTCIGVSQDGKRVYMFAVDGRNFHYSNGMNYKELAQIMKALGSYNAINLDGGGSTTFFVRKTAEMLDNRFEIRNWPTDNGGMERAVANGLVIVSPK